MSEERKPAWKRSQHKLPPRAGAVGPQESDARGAFLTVGLGATADGLAAFAAFFSGTPPAGEPGMADVPVTPLGLLHRTIQLLHPSHAD